ncbi:hypothetical protein CANTEDRAFT_109310 [Yamadazyma tenuis ATCC 10573]|uniref:Allantoin permease n=2 Tax=Candida tenuis TaxID=2315449 RepID=G3B884_CANTC|nr:uncharacterized protein CANTEDRAFT_109310 [Yamadazyma tenuis ATCC 10573]EGV61710.1 hypothetical protein CANTEDRAFT_109310 [Yamadazyma tenuis ATCC 10573]
MRSNLDLKPTPPQDRTWKVYNYVLIWFQSTFNVNEWNTGASLMKETNLPHGQVIGAAIVGIFLTCIFTVSNARVGSSYHLGYNVLVRSTFGIYLGYFMVFVRFFIALIWFGVQSYYGSQMFNLVLRCIFGYKWTDLPNHLPASADITTGGILAFFLYWLIQMPLMWCHPKHIRYFFTFKAITLPFATLGLFIFCVVRGHGPGDWSTGVTVVSTSSRGNQWMAVFNTIFGTLSPMIINQPDIARYAKRKEDTVVPQAIGFIPPKICVIVFAMVGVVSLKRAYGEVYWNMWDLLHAILDNEWSAGSRTAVFFLSLLYAAGTAGTNIFANSIPFATDITGLLPRYFNIIRGQIVCGFLCWAIVPWKFLANATQFLTFLGSYSIFVAPLIGCLLSDYYIIRRGNIHVPSLYTKKSSGVYHYYKGVNIWGFFAWALSTVLGIPGLYSAYNPGTLNDVATEIYDSGWLYTFISGFVLYTVLGLIFKPRVFPDGHEDTPKTWEYMTSTDGFFEEDASINGVGYPGKIYIEGSEEDSAQDEKLKIITSIKSGGGLYM